MKHCSTFCLTLLILTLATPARPADWPTWRGPGGLGVSEETDLPDRWDFAGGTVWEAAIPGTSTSTPVVWGERIFVTSQLGRSPLAEGEGGTESDSQLTFLVIALDKSSGEEIWRREIASEGKLPSTHLKHNLASPSPVTDGQRVVAWFSTGQAVAFDLDGKQVWQRNLAREYGAFDIRWAHGSSPVLYEGKVILLCEHTTAYMLALDADTGENVWRVDRPDPGRSYTTPLLVEHDGRTDLVINARERIDVYDPETGAFRWSVGQPNRTPVSTPVHADGVLYASRGYRSGPYMAVRLGDHRGDVTESHTIWRVATGAPYVSSLLYYRGLVFMATETGVVSAIDAKSGETAWRQRLGGNFSASPVGADGKLYLANEEGEFFVLAAGREFELRSRTELDEGIKASPVISGGRVFVRTATRLYAF